MEVTPSATRQYLVLLTYGLAIFSAAAIYMDSMPLTEAGEILSTIVVFEMLIVFGFCLNLWLEGGLWGCRLPESQRSSIIGWRFRLKHIVALTCAFIVAPATLLLVLMVGIYGLTGALKLASLLNPPYYLLLAFHVLAAYLAFALCGVPIARLLLRIAPPRPHGKIRWGSIISAALLGIVIIANGHNAREVIQNGSTLLIAIMIAAGCFFPVLIRQLRPAAFLKSDYIILLRRFSSFSDRIVAGKVLAAKPNEGHVVLMTPTRTQTSDWNPLLICFQGLSLISPLKRVPIFLREQDTDWRAPAEKYIAGAKRVVLDASEETDAIEDEIDILESNQHWPKVMTIKGANQPLPEEIPNDIAVIDYEKSWWFVLPKLFMAGFLMVMTLSGVAYLMQIGTAIIRDIGYSAVPALLPIPFFQLAMFFALFVTFLIPSMTIASSRRLKQWARSAPSTSLSSAPDRKVTYLYAAFLAVLILELAFLDIKITSWLPGAVIGTVALILLQLGKRNPGIQLTMINAVLFSVYLPDSLASFWPLKTTYLELTLLIAILLRLTLTDPKPVETQSVPSPTTAST